MGKQRLNCIERIVKSDCASPLGLKGLEEQATSASAKATESAQEVQHLQALLSVKEETVAQLQEELENEKQKRLIREREVEEKAAHIKSWMHKKISEYEEKLEELNKENDHLKRSHKQAMDVVKEIETKLSFSQDQVLRLSHELADIQSQSPDYYELEPETNQGESGFQSYLTEDTVCNESPVNSLGSGCTTPTPMSPDELVKTPTNDDDRDDSSAFISDQAAEIKIKRTSSGKSPSKIPRFIGTVEDQRAAQISYYMSLKRGMRSPGGSRAKFFIQIQDSHNPYMQLTPLERMSQRKQFDSQSTIDSEIDDSSFETYVQPVEPGVHGEEFHARLGELVTLQLENGSLTPSVSQNEQESLSDSRSSLGYSTEDASTANPIYQTLEPEPDSVRTCTDSAVARKPLVDSGVPLSPPPPPVPPRFELENVAPPPVPPVPRTNKEEQMQDVTRLKGNFTSYLSETDLPNGNAPEGNKVDIAAVLLPSNRTDSWMWNDNSAGSDTPPFGTLETRTKNLNMLTEQSCPVYTTLKGRASQIRNTPFSGESTDSSDDESSAGDYCTPPDELGATEEHHNFKQDTDELLEETKRVLKTCATYTTVSLKKENQRKEGYLTKLGGRVKNWKKRWFVLHDGNLYYYKTENDVNRKPLGQIPLDGSCRIARTDGELTIEVATPKRTFYLTGETTEVVDSWLRVLHNVMRKFSSTPLFAQVKDKEIVKGWLTKVKHGSSKKCWSVLRGQYLCYYKSDDDSVPFSMTHMIDVVVEELESPDSEDGTLNTDEVPYRHFTLVMKSLKQPSTTYLLIDSMEEKDSWLFHLKVASGSGIDDMGTEFEKSIYQLIVEDCDPESEIWNSYVLTHSKDPIIEPLTTLPSKELGAEALKLFKSIHLFTTVQTQEAAIDYHVSLAQNALQTCLDNPELQNEIYCQLIKQTSKHVHRGPEDLGHFLEHCGKSSWLREDSFDIASQATIDLRPVQEFVYIQAWQLLSLCTALFVPKKKFLLFLRGHLNRTSTFKTKLGKYATYCIRSLERSLQNGKREARPSRLEVLSILLRKPYDHSCLMSIPVHFFDGSSQVFGFDGSTTIQEFSETINRMVGIRSSSESGYALFTDNPVNLVEHCLQVKVKLCDVISKWEQALRSQSQGKLDTSRMIKLTYKNRLHFKSLSSGETEKEKYFLVLQTNDSIVKGRFPVSKEMALEFAALMAQISYGDYRAQSNSLPSKRIVNVITKFCAKTLREDTSKRALTLRMAEKWSTLHGWSVKECVDKYLENARRWPFFGCKLFQAQQKHTVSAAKKRTAPVSNTQPVWLAVEEDCINLLEGNSLRLMCRYRYKHVVTFGGWKEDFMLVVNQSIMRGGNTVEQGTQRLLFVMPRAKILEITLLMASYINAIVRQKGITCDAPGTGTATGQAVDVKVWDLESAEWPMVPGSTVGLL
ncbi:pleckstrin homology domain-containing family H member 2-like isoform X3 [Stylophora pistillata]|uniref:pleckstrin homology domain-containing family H member 2-like isoform X3 n=1 Tax=Stylophora pistillata TaxID=50429 RepID=UPI000C051866|nr:pleckstrin homology domain-containing family H member 2-like isoform X3 [Stylophora pistillata]